MLSISDPVLDVGTKYVQKVGKFTPSNVKPIGRRTDQISIVDGVRMEDCANVNRSVGQNQCTLIVIADGHGSVPVYSEDATEKGATVWIGGYDIASLAVDSITRYITEVAERIPLSTLTKQGMATVFHDAFSYAQKRCDMETIRGARPIHCSDPFDQNRLGQLVGSAVDGYYFKNLYINGTISGNPWVDKRCLVADKILEPYNNGHLAYYISGDGKKKVLAEYGSTATALLVCPYHPEEGESLPNENRVPTQNGVPHEQPLYRVYVAHAGDSDVYLFYKNANGLYVPTKLTGDHSIANRNEIQRLEPHGMKPRDPYFALAHGPERGQALMPSRSLGHTLLKNHGITFEPTVATTMLMKGDIIVAATDGLWASYGRARNEIPIPMTGFHAKTPEDLSAVRVAAILDRHSNSNPDIIGNKIKEDLVKVVDLRDNVAIVVLKVE